MNDKEPFKYLTSLVHFYNKIKTVFATKDEIDGKASLDSPTFTGTPQAPTASVSTNTDQIATTAFVTTAISKIVKVENENLIINI